jgi:hypothetical protein
VVVLPVKRRRKRFALTTVMSYAPGPPMLTAAGVVADVAAAAPTAAAPVMRLRRDRSAMG